MQKRNLGLAALALLALAGCGGDGSGGGLGGPTAGEASGAAEAAGAVAGPPIASPAGALAGTSPTPAPMAAEAAPATLAPPVAAAGAVNAPPVISGTPTTRLRVDTDFEFQPSASDPDADPLQFSATQLPAWAALDAKTGRVSGRPRSSDSGVFGPVTLSVSDGRHTVSLPAFEFTVEPVATGGTVTLSWRPPERNEDGSLITQPPIFRIHYGRNPRAYDNVITLPRPGITRHALTNLEAGTWYLAMTSVATDGLESEYSAETMARVN